MRIAVAIGLAVILFVGCVPLYLHLKQKYNPVMAAAAKGLASVVPVVLCLLGCLRGVLPSAWWMFAGLCLCLAADVAICAHFFAGMGVFLAAHLCFIVSLLEIASVSPWSIPVFILSALLVAAIFFKMMRKMGLKSIPYVVYGIVILSMLSMALVLPFTLGGKSWYIGFGALLFFISDMLLAYSREKPFTRLGDGASLYVYYAGTYLLAMSIFV